MANRTYAPLTKGIEFEFAIPWYFDTSGSGKTVEPGVEEDYKIIDGCVCVSKGRASLFVPLAHVTWSDGMDVARRAVYEVLAANGVDVNEPGPYKYKALPGDEHHRNAANTSAPAYLRWNITSDGSITGDMREEAWEEDFDADHDHDRQWEIADVELVSPAVPAGSKADDDEIRRVIDIVNDNFHCFYPSSCGLHVHVAQGREIFPIEDLRRIAAAIFGVDVWFERLHPQHRQFTTYARPTRKFSRISQGATGAWANMVVSETGLALLFPVDPSGDTPVIAPIQAWTELSVVQDNRAVDILFSTCSNASYNLANVANSSKPTIEFRQAAGTLNGEWAVHWSNLVAGLVDWARRSTNEGICQFLTNAQWKENARNSPQFEVDQLIREVLGLPEIADYIARTTPDTRTYPRLDPKQSKWRRLMKRKGCKSIGKQMWPRDDWPP